MAMPCIKYPVLLLNHTSHLGRTAHGLLFFLHAGQKIKVHDANCSKIVPPPSTTPSVTPKIFSPAVASVAFLAGDFPSPGKKRELAKQMLAESGNNFTLVAAQLGINPTTLWRWRKAENL